MTTANVNPPWSGLEQGDVMTPTPLPVHRDRPLLFGLVKGSITIVIRAVRTDGRLGAAEPLLEADAGQVIVVPPDRAGRVIEVRASHDARWQPLSIVDAPVPSLDQLQTALRLYFQGSAELQDWITSLDSSVSWSTVVGQLAEQLDAQADATIASAAARVRERLSRLQTLDDETLSEAVRVMTSTNSRAASVSAADQNPSLEVLAILKVIESMDVSAEAASGLAPIAVIHPIEYVARTLHMQYRQVRMEGRWWQESAGPLYTKKSADGTPVALIPRAGGYVAFEYHGGEVRKIDLVTKDSAAAYDEMATMFYRPLPGRSVRMLDLLRLICSGNLRDVLTLVGVTVATSALVALVPILTGMIIGTVIPGVERAQLIFIGAMLVSIAVSRALVHVVAGIAFLRIETRSSFQVVAALVDRVLQLPASFFRETSAGDLTQRVMAVEQVRASLTQSVFSVFISLVASFSNLAVLFYYDVSMGLTAIAVIAVELVLVVWISISMAKLDYKLSVAKGELDGFGIDMLLGIRQIRLQGSRNRVLAQLLTRLGRVGAFTYRSGLLGVWLALVVGATFTITLAIVFLEFTASLRDPTEATVLAAGGFVAFITALSAFLGAVVGISPAIKAVASMVPQIHRIRPILEAETEVGETGGDIVTLHGGVAARGIEFRYGPKLPLVLDGVDIEAKPGEFIAIVGGTGCGKSTLLSVLLGLERPAAGQVLYDKMPLENLDPAVVRSQVGVVMQSNETIAGSVQSTILGIGSRRTIDDAWAAARMVGMEDEIDQMPMGMLTMVTPNALSQSQLQRLLVARALVGRPEVLFLDEATSALSNTAQAEITRSIDGLGSTRVVIAHRLSTIRNADRIYVLDHGRVVQSGTFAELEAEGGTFTELMAGQVS